MWDKRGCDLVVDPFQQSVTGRIISAIQGDFKSKCIRRAVALEHQPAQAEQGRAAVATVVNAPFEAI